MTINELSRAIKSKQRIEKNKAKEKASYDYILADLIGRSISRLYATDNNYPTIEEVYPTIFNEQENQENKQARQTEKSVIRFRQFADYYNKNYQGGGKDR